MVTAILTFLVSGRARCYHQIRLLHYLKCRRVLFLRLHLLVSAYRTDRVCADEVAVANRLHFTPLPHTRLLCIVRTRGVTARYSEAHLDPCRLSSARLDG